MDVDVVLIKIAEILEVSQVLSSLSRKDFL